jgi:predicted TIM-barrel fold metal-dependent hydrolase
MHNVYRVLSNSLLGAALLAFGGLARAEAPYTMADFARVHKIDAHVHDNVVDDVFLALARKDNFELISINVDYPDFPNLAGQANVAHTLRARDPAHFHFATAFSMKGFLKPGWAERVEQRIDAEKKAGAVAVKIWKNVGLVETDAKGRKIMLDDPRFDPVIAHMIALHLPLLDHQGEPKNCWLPLDQMTTDNDRSYFKEHPGYYMYLHPEGPSYETLMTARDRFVARHPDLRFVGAHLASLEWSVDRLAAFLDRYPNANVDMAARMTQVMYQSARDTKKVRAFFIKYQDRILYGSDLTQNPVDKPAEFTRESQAFWQMDWRYLATTETQHVGDLHADIKGLALPRGVIEKIYYGNAKRIYLAGQ